MFDLERLHLEFALETDRRRGVFFGGLSQPLEFFAGLGELPLTLLGEARRFSLTRRELFLTRLGFGQLAAAVGQLAPQRRHLLGVAGVGLGLDAQPTDLVLMRPDRGGQLGPRQLQRVQLAAELLERLGLRLLGLVRTFGLVAQALCVSGQTHVVETSLLEFLATRPQPLLEPLYLLRAPTELFTKPLAVRRNFREHSALLDPLRRRGRELFFAALGPGEHRLVMLELGARDLDVGGQLRHLTYALGERGFMLTEAPPGEFEFRLDSLGQLSNAFAFGERDLHLPGQAAAFGIERLGLRTDFCEFGVSGVELRLTLRRGFVGAHDRGLEVLHRTGQDRQVGARLARLIPRCGKLRFERVHLLLCARFELRSRLGQRLLVLAGLRPGPLVSMLDGIAFALEFSLERRDTLRPGARETLSIRDCALKLCQCCRVDRGCGGSVRRGNQQAATRKQRECSLGRLRRCCQG